MTRVALRVIMGAVLMSMLSGGCSSDKRTADQKFQAYLDEGNAAFKTKKYEDALSAYKHASDLPNVTHGAGAGYYGMSMAYEALGKPDEAKQALAKAGELSPGLAAPHGAMEGAGVLNGAANGGLGANPHAGMSGMAGMGDSVNTGATGGGGPRTTSYADSGWVTRGDGH